jgi:flagellar biosynthetic protein FliQ
MNEDMVLSIGSEAIQMVIMIAGPMLGAALVIGLIVSTFQAITQINEATLTFIPKMIAVVAVLALTAPWMLKLMEDYSVNVFGNFVEYIK